MAVPASTWELGAMSWAMTVCAGASGDSPSVTSPSTSPSDWSSAVAPSSVSPVSGGISTVRPLTVSVSGASLLWVPGSSDWATTSPTGASSCTYSTVTSAAP